MVPDPAASTTPAPSRTQVFARRLATFVILWSAVLAALFCAGPAFSNYFFLGVMVALSAIGLREFYALAEQRGLVCFKAWGMVGGALLMISTFVYSSGEFGREMPPSKVNDFETSILVVLVLGVCLRQLFAPRNPAGLPAIAVTLLGLLYVPWLLNFLQKIHFFYQANANGRYYLLYFILVTKCSDTGAYVVGTLLGRHKLIPRLSPGKTWEGLAGALAVATGASAAFAALAGPHLVGMTFLHSIILGLLLGGAAVVGDLIESMFKREAGVKDSGRLLPGMGGMLDLLDSLLFNAPLMYLYLRHILSHQ